MKNCPVCNTQVEDLYTGLCPNSLCSWEFEFISSEMTPELQKRYAEKLAKCRHLYELNIASDKRDSTHKDKKKEEEKKDYDIEELRDKNRIELKFIALNELNNAKEAVLFNKYNWFYGGDLSNKLWLNLDNWTIYSDRMESKSKRSFYGFRTRCREQLSENRFAICNGNVRAVSKQRGSGLLFETTPKRIY